MKEKQGPLTEKLATRLSQKFYVSIKQEKE